MSEIGEVPEWPNGADCKSAGSAFGGSNPSLSTKEENRFRQIDSAGVTQVVESQPSKLLVAGSSPVSRSRKICSCSSVGRALPW